MRFLCPWTGLGVVKGMSECGTSQADVQLIVGRGIQR